MIGEKVNLSATRTPVEYVESGEHLPHFMRDFHDQKELFKSIHEAYRLEPTSMPNWTQAHIYTVDWFLWYMGQRGYTLQKSRAKVKFKKLKHEE